LALPFAVCWSTMKQSSRASKEALEEMTEPLLEAVHQVKQEQVTRL